jgi:hypothetical protein
MVHSRASVTLWGGLRLLLQLQDFLLLGFDGLVDLGDVAVGELLDLVVRPAVLVLADHLVLEQLLDVLVGVAPSRTTGSPGNGGIGANSGRSGLQHHEGFGQLGASLGYQPPNRRCEHPAGGRWESDQDHSRRIQMCGEDKPAEVFVFREQQPILRQRQFHDFLVDGALLKLAYRQHIMPIQAQSANYGEIAAFVREESHGRHYSGVGARTASWATLSAAYARAARKSSAVKRG